jgi:rSAM/selenodomain-associated transferase 1
MNATHCRIILFLKAPRPGLVKTRLARGMGPEEAARAYRSLVETLLQELAPLSRVTVRFTPDNARPDIEAWLRPGWSALPQGEGDLGRRLDRAVRDAFDQGPEPILILGSDCPWVTRHDLREAETALSESDVVFGPALDGGYWLVGMRRFLPSLFRDIPWSTADTLAVSRRRAAEDGCRVRLLRALSDVDTMEDWRAYLQAVEE